MSFLAFMRLLIFWEADKHINGLSLLFVYYVMCYLPDVYSLLTLSYLRGSEQAEV